MLKKVYFILSLSLMVLPAMAQDRKNHWVDSVFQRLTLPEKIGQLFMIPFSSYWTGDTAASVEDAITHYHVGSLYLTKGGPLSQAKMINRFNRLAEVPLIVGLDAEWGLGQTLDSTMSFPKPMALGAIRNDSLVYHLGETIALQMKMLGLHINFAPRVDLYRSGLPGEFYFSDQKNRLAMKSMNFMLGLQDQGITAVAKQSPKATGKFPDVQDSVAYFELSRIDTSEMNAHIQLIHHGLHGLLTSNFSFSIAGKKKAVPAAVSSVFINEIVKNEMGFQGLTFTEVPVLQQISGKNRNGEAELLAFMIGNDVLIAPLNPGAAVKKIKKAIKKDKALLNQLNKSVKKILSAKFEAGLSENRFVNTDNLMLRLHTPEAELFQHRLAEAAVTVVRNDAEVIPIKTLENKRFIFLSLGEGQNEFDQYLTKYAPMSTLSVRSLSDTLGLSSQLDKADIIIIGINRSAVLFQKNIIPIIKRLAPQKAVILCGFGNPDDLKPWEGFPTIVEAYSGQDLMPKIAAQIIFGGMSAQGVLPISISRFIPTGSGINTTTQDRLMYTLPEAAGMDSRVLEQIKVIAQEAIDLKATPGCRVLVAKDGKVVYDRSFGWLTYENKIPVTEETIYDLASLTKVSATLQTVMFLQEKGLIDINKKISVYLPELKGSNKQDFIIKDILTHQAGLWPFIPFWAQTMKDSLHLPEFYSPSESPDYSFAVSKNLFAKRAMKDSLWQWIINAKIIEKSNRTPYEYRYSDMGFYILQHLAEKILNQPMEEFLEQNWYEPLGAYTTGYLPLRKFSAIRIAPTEDDKLFRKSLLTGFVHDQGAAMQGGIAGHAGLFSTANDLAKLGQMWLQGGRYAGHQYLKPETLELFTHKQYENSRRGLGWDRPVPGIPDGPTSMYASQKTFGHTGFTGTCIWVDPEFNLVYVFLSNRVHPNMNNNKILNANIRPRIQDVIYKSIFTYCEHHN